MLKISLLTGSLLFSNLLPSPVATPPTGLERVIASAVRVSPIEKKNGSGNVIKKNGKAFVLTNAHVCLPNSAMLTNPNLYEKFKNTFFNYRIKSFNHSKTFKIKLRDIKYNSYYDLCLIPLPPAHQFKALNYPQKTPKIVKKENYLFFNLNNKDEVLKTKNLFNKDNYFVPFDSISYTTSDKQEHSRPRGEYYRLEGQVKGGDSGSLVFNSNLELIGQVFGSNYSTTEPQGSILEKKFIDEFLNDSLALPELSALHGELKEIY